MNKLVEFPITADIRSEAAEWLVRLDGDKALSVKDREALGAWISQSDMHRRALQEAASLWGDLNILTELAVPLDKPVQRKSSGRTSIGGLPMRMAAAAVLATVALLVFYQVRPDPFLSTNGFVATAVGERRAMTLADGSVVHLNTDSQIKIEYSADVRRIDLLRGEAHFSVAKNRHIPFLVDAGLGRIEAVGTAFSVYRREDSVDVTVTEGRVALSAESIPTVAGPAPQVAVTIAVEPVVLDAGQAATIDVPSIHQSGMAGTVAIDREISDRDLTRKLLWKDGMLAFSRAPLRDVISEIGRYTTMRIEFADEADGDTPVIARFPIDGDAESLKDILENQLGLDVISTGPNSILLSSRDNR